MDPCAPTVLVSLFVRLPGPALDCIAGLELAFPTSLTQKTLLPEPVVERAWLSAHL